MNPRNVKSALLNAALGLLCSALTPGLARAQPPAADALDAGGDGQRNATELVLLAVSLNGDSDDRTFLFARRGDGFLVPTDALTALRIRQPGIPPVTIEGQAFVPLSSLPGVTARFDAESQRMLFTVPAEGFESTSISVSGRPPAPSESSFGAFVNYDLSLQHDHSLSASGYLETGLSDDWGLITNTMLLGQSSGSKSATRLDTYFLHDDPDHMTRLVIGDTVTDARDWSRQLRFGGVRFGTEFALQPATITFPTPDFAGRTTVPSNVELLINNVQRFQTDVGEGPFSISQAPVVTGAGEVTLVIRDALGVERRIKSSYYVSPRLLRRGLSAWSIEAGAERRDYGIANFSYENPFMGGSYRRGMTDRLTLEGRSEISGDVQMIGGGADIVLPAIGEFGVAAAASHAGDGSGALYRIFFSRITPAWNISASYQRATRHYSELGVSRDEERIRSQLQASAGLSLGRLGNAGIAYTDLRYADDNRARVASANYSFNFGSRAYVSLYALHSRFTAMKRATTLGIGLTIPLGRRTSSFAQADNRGTMAEIRRTPPFDRGWGYRLAAGTGETDRQQAELDWRDQAGEYSLQAARFNGDTSVRLLASGGLLFAGGGVQAMRRADGGFAVVDVPGQADVRVYQENRLVARTNSRGIAVVPQLRPYEENRIAIAPGDLPLDASMANDTMIITPRYRGTVRARFEVKRETAATVVLQLPDGRAVDAGTSAAIDGKEWTFVGYGGELFIHTLHSGAVIEIEGPDGPCKAVIEHVPTGEPLPRIGPIRCIKVTNPK